MPICPHCSLGIPPSFVVCPDCGRRLVEVAATTTLDDHIEVVEIHGLSDMFVDALPGEVSPELEPGLLPSPSPKPVRQPRPASETRTSPRRPPKTRARPDKAARALEARPTKVKRPTKPRVGKLRSTPVVAEREEIVSGPKTSNERNPKVRRAITRPSRRRKRQPPDEKKERLKPSRPVTKQEEQPAPLPAIQEQSQLSVEVSDEVEVEVDEALAGDQFVGTAKGFARIKSHPGLEAPSHAGARKTVRWAHRAYRGEVEVHATTGGASCTLVVFGDGLVLIGAAGGLVPAFAGRFVRRRQRVLNLAGSSAEAQASVPGSKRIAAAEVETVHIENGRMLQRELKIRTFTGEQFGYRFPSKRHRQIISLLAPVLGGKLRDSLKSEKAASRS